MRRSRTAAWAGSTVAAVATLLARLRVARPRARRHRGVFIDSGGRLPTPITFELAPLSRSLTPDVPADVRSSDEAGALAPDIQDLAARVLYAMLGQLRTGVALNPPYFLAPDTNALIALERHAADGTRAFQALAFRECARFVRTELTAWDPRLLVTPVIYYEFARRTPPASAAMHEQTLRRVAALLAPLGLPVWVAGVATFAEASAACHAIEADVASLTEALRTLKAIDWVTALAVRGQPSWLPMVTHIVERHVGPVATRVLDAGAVQLALLAVTEQLVRESKALPKERARLYRYAPWEPVARLVKERSSRPLEGVGDVDLFGLHNVQHQFATDAPITVLALTAEKKLAAALVANNSERRIRMSFRAGEPPGMFDERWRAFVVDHARLDAWELAHRDYAERVMRFLDATPWLSPSG